MEKRNIKKRVFCLFTAFLLFCNLTFYDIGENIRTNAYHDTDLTNMQADREYDQDRIKASIEKKITEAEQRSNGHEIPLPAEIELTPEESEYISAAIAKDRAEAGYTLEEYDALYNGNEDDPARSVGVNSFETKNGRSLFSQSSKAASKSAASKGAASSDWYYDQLNDGEKQIWNDIYGECVRFMNSSVTSTTGFFASINIKGRGIEQCRTIYDIFHHFWRSNPQFFFLEQVWSGVGSDGSFSFGTQSYFRNAADRNRYRDEINRITAEWLPLIYQYDTPHERVNAINNLLYSAGHYAYYNYDESGGRNQTIAGVFVDRKAVCGGFSMAFEYLCNLSGIPCTFVESYGDHAWNVIDLYGEWYHYDVLWEVKGRSEQYTLGVESHDYHKTDPYYYSEKGFSIPVCPKDFDASSVNILPVHSTVDSVLAAVPFKTDYIVGEKLDTSGGKIRLDHDNYTSSFVDITPDMIRGFSSSAAKELTLTVVYNGRTLGEYAVTVSARSTSGKQIESMNAFGYREHYHLMTYTIPRLDLEGTKLRVNYTDGTHDEISVTPDMLVDPSVLSNLGNAAINSVYSCRCGYAEIFLKYGDKTTSYKVYTHCQCDLKAEAENRDYFAGEDLRLDEITLTLTYGCNYNNGTPVELPVDKSKVTSAKIKNSSSFVIVYSNYAIEFKIIEHSVELQSIRIKTMPKTSYAFGEELDLTGGVIELIYNNGKTETVDMTAGPQVSGFDSKKAGKQTLCVYYNDKMTAYDITVAEEIGHSWGAVTYTWSADYRTCTAARVCANDASHVETETVNTTYAVTAKPTTTSEGIGTYTAAFSNTAFAAQTKTITIPKETYEWGEPSYSWSDDLKTCTATRTAASDPSHKETETVNVIYAVTTKPTCTAKGIGTYYAVFSNAAFASQTKTVDAAAIDHSWGAVSYTWSGDNKTCTAARVCGNDASHEETETVNTAYAVTGQPTCTAMGTGTYTAAFTNAVFAAQEKTVDIPAEGHHYVDTVVPPTSTEQGYTLHKCSECGDSYTDTYTAPITAITVAPKFDGKEDKTYTDITLTADGKIFTADSTGNITITGLANGTCEAVVSKPAYAPRKVTITVGAANEDIVICKYGDVTGDGSIDTEDIARMQQKISKWSVNYVYDETADLNGDGEMDTEDLARLQQYVSGWNVKLGKVS